MPGTMIAFPANGRKTAGFLALPPGGRGPALIVVQEWWGLTGHITAVARGAADLRGAAEATLAWTRTLAFLREHVR